MKKVYIFAIMMHLAGLGGAAKALELKSPDGNLTVKYELREGSPVYRVDYSGNPVIVDSPLGLELENGSLAGNLTSVKETFSKNDSTWSPVCGERAVVRDHYNQVAVELKQVHAPGLSMILTIRAYDEGAAFCYTLPAQGGMTNFTIKRENSCFAFAADHQTWATYSAQGLYEKVTLSRVKAGCERPLIVQAATNLFAALAEARLVDYARMKLQPSTGLPYALEALLDADGGKYGTVKGITPFTTPWRVVMIASNPCRLMEQNYIIQNLNEPCTLSDTSWIRPGKLLREVTLTTEGAMRAVDFAASNKFQYIMFDAGWYGHEYDDAADATQISVDPERSPGPLALHDVIRYGRSKDIGVILYVNRRALERQLDKLLPLYREWGVAGVKYGFVQVGSQKWTSWLHEAIKKAAEQRLVVDVHDEYRPTGFSRTYPNLLTVEGIAGDEASPSNASSLTIFFSRFLAGPADQTYCYFDPRVGTRIGTHAYQLAKSICFFSPLQSIYWYDRPAPAGVDPAAINAPAAAPTGVGGVMAKVYKKNGCLIGSEPELEFFKDLPTIWDDTRVLQGEIGKFLLVARKKADRWFVGFMNSSEERRLNLPLDFLDDGVEYNARIYTDDKAVPTRTQVRIETRRVKRGDMLALAAGITGGVAVIIEKDCMQLQSGINSTSGGQ